MARLITEHQEFYIRQSIPLISKNIHEASLGGFVRGALRLPGALASGIGTAASGLYHNVVRPGLSNIRPALQSAVSGMENLAQNLPVSAHNDVLNRHMNLHNTFILPRVASTMGYSTQEADRLWTWGHQPPTPPTKPGYHMTNPNFNPNMPISNTNQRLIPKPIHIFRDEMLNYDRDLEKHNKMVAQHQAVQGLAASDPHFGQLYRTLHGIPPRQGRPGTPGAIQYGINMLNRVP